MLRLTIKAGSSIEVREFAAQRGIRVAGILSLPNNPWLFSTFTPDEYRAQVEEWFGETPVAGPAGYAPGTLLLFTVTREGE